MDIRGLPHPSTPSTRFSSLCGKGADRQNTFYATETAATRYKIVYYPHEAWSLATKPHFDHLQQNFLQELDSVSPSFFLPEDD
jgi:hypothetical protein